MIYHLICSGGDPNQHILDTLEQCISVIIEKRHQPSNPLGSIAETSSHNNSQPNSRLSSLDYARANGDVVPQGTYSTLPKRRYVSFTIQDPYLVL